MNSRSCRAHSLIFALFFLAACAGSQDLPAPAKLWTVEDLQRLARNGGATAGIPASTWVALRGQALPLLSPPFTDAQQLQRSDMDGLNVYPAFSEGRTAAYTTTEIWENFPAIWVQPLYLPITGFANGAAVPLPGAYVIFSVGTRTRFYSPFWVIHYLVVPPETAPDRFTSSKQVLDSGYPIIEGRGTLCVIAPPDVQLAQPPGNKAVRPLFNQQELKVNYSTGWVDGVAVSYIDFGRNRFTWNEANVVDEAALFDLGVRNDAGGYTSLNLPRVGGTGPLLSNTPARVIGPRPQFGALWHVYQSYLPAGAGVFIPSSKPGLRAQVVAAANQSNAAPEASVAPPIAPQNEARADAPNYLLRTAVNASCFQDVNNFPESCRWLDSQAAVEREIPRQLILDTGLYQTCPFLAYNDVPVPP
jgi:hypothetical protein